MYNKCPTCRLNFEYKIKNEIYNSLNKLLFECLFKNKGCKNILSYSQYFNHINNCKYNNIIEYECNIKKYNYLIEEHVKNKCQLKIEKYHNGNKYIGEKK